MSNRYKPQHNRQVGKPFELNGEPCLFRFGGNALAELEGAMGMTQREIFELATKQDLSVRLTRAMVWAALLHESPDLTLRDAGDIIDPYLQDPEQFTALRLAIAEAFVGAFPEVKKDESKNEAAPITTGGETTEKSAQG